MARGRVKVKNDKEKDLRKVNETKEMGGKWKKKGREREGKRRKYNKNIKKEREEKEEKHEML